MTNISRITHTRPDGTTFTVARLVEEPQFAPLDRPADRSRNHSRGARKSTHRFRTIL